MNDRSIEYHALLLLWTTLRQTLQPELTSALAKDRAKRSDAALLRLIAGYKHLPSVRTAFADRYSQLLGEVQDIARSSGAVIADKAPASALADNPAFVGIPGVAEALERQLLDVASASKSSAAIDSMVQRVAELELDLRVAYETAATGLRPVAEHAAKPVTASALEAYLRAHPSGEPNVRVESVTEIPGGRSKRTVLATLSAPGRLPPAIVLRMDTGRGVGTTVSEEFPMLERVARAGMPVPEPLWLESSNEPFGFPFIVFRRMPGSAAGDLMEGAFNKVPETGRALARALGAVHGGGAALIDDPELRGSSVRCTQMLLDYYYDWWQSKKPFPSLIIEAAFIWLRQHINDGLGESTVVHADTAFHNLLMDDAGNICLLDWEFAHFGDPAEDLASCRPAVERCMPWQDFMAEYCAHGGKPVSDFRLNYFEIWRPLRNAVVCGTVMHSLMNGEADDIDPVTIALSTFQRLQADLAKSLTAIAGGGG
jgi:aminoglycoside phosphotransferase (APT) family kinase protein